jgi:CheY-like chemotaxis protein
MAAIAQDPARQAFERDLRRALQHLYDPAKLGRSSLLELFGLRQRDDPASSLQRLLLDAIQTLRPKAQAPSDSAARRLHYILNQRYVQQFSQADVARNLAMGGRHVRRLQVQALQALADYLWARYELANRAVEQGPANSTPEPWSLSTGVPSQEQELEWLTKSYRNEPLELAPVLQALLKTVAPLSQALNVEVVCAIPDGLPRLAVQPMATRQAVLNVLTAAIRATADGRVEIGVEVRPGEVMIAIGSLVQGRGAASLLPRKAQESLEMARQLLALSDGSLEVQTGQDARSPFRARLVLPAAGVVTVLVIDDNTDTLQLFQRYLEGSRYRFVGLHDPQDSLTLVTEYSPQVIVLDVMLPGVDGWELLQRLREHPQTRNVPIIVCTILPEDDLALALGAAGFVRKPVNQGAFLAALDRLVP